jgi:hypothetical protein
MTFSIIIQYNVPFSRKEEAKNKYLKWNPTDKKWYNSFKIKNNVITEKFSESLKKCYAFYSHVLIEFEIYDVKIYDYDCPIEHLEEIKNTIIKIRDIKIEHDEEKKKQMEDPNYICDY